MHSNVRQWRRCERRWEIAFVIGPVAPPSLSSAPVSPVFVFVIDDVRLLSTIHAIFYTIGQQTYSCENDVRCYAWLLPAHKLLLFVRPLSALKIVALQLEPWPYTCFVK
jgi:hypothetical protein